MKKILLISLAVVLALSVSLIGCGGDGEELPSDYIGSGALDGNGIPVDFFSDIDVRKGFSYCFNWDIFIADAMSGQGVQRGSPVVEGLYGYDADTPMYSLNLTLAQAHMEDAWDGEVWEKGFKMTLLYNVGNVPRKIACEILAENLADINEKFEVSILPLAWPVFLSKLFGGDMPMFLVGWLPDYPHADNFIVPFMHSQGTFSGWQGYGYPELDAMIAAAFQETDGPTQMGLYAAIQQRYHDDAPGIVLAQPIARRYFTEHIDGFYYNPTESSYAGRIYDLTKSDQGGPIPYENPGTFVFQTIGDIDSLDPAWCYDTSSGMQLGLIYETLLYYSGNKTDEFDPILATAWAFNETTLEYRFTIREGVQFHNGNNLTPEDVEYTFERAMCQDRPAGPVWMFYQPLLGPDVWAYEDTTFADIDAAVEVDGNDVVFTLAGAYWELPFLQVMSGQWASIVDKEWCIVKGDWDGTEGDVTNFLHPQDAGDTALFDDANGTGPWKLNLWEPGIQVKVEKNTNYWRAEAPFDWVITQDVTEWTSRKLALQNGDADLVYVPSTYFDEMDSVTGLNVYIDLPSLTVDAFFFNMNIGADF